MTLIEPTRKGEAVQDRTCLMVLGMHRSGTSALAGTIALAGCDAPRTLMEKNENNEKGYFESAAIWDLHNRILHTIGISWDDWFGLDDGWLRSPQGETLLGEAVAMLEQEFGHSRLFVFKDPRICRLNAFWAEALARFGARPLYILTHRNPVEVAASLNRRDDLHPHFGQLLWLRYTLDGEAATRGQPRSFTSYARLMRDRTVLLGDLEEALGFRFPKRTGHVREAVDSFLEDALRHFNDGENTAMASPDISPWVRDTFEIMERWAASGEDAAGRTALDRIRAELDRAETLFGALVRDGRNIRRELKNIARIKTDAKQAAQDLAHLRDDAETAQSRHAARIAALEKDLSETDHRLYDLECRLSVAQTEAREQRGQAGVLARKLGLRDQELGLLTRRLVEIEAAPADDAAITEARAKAHAACEALAREEHEKQALAARVADLENHVRVIQQTLSWRVTKPLRAVRRLLPHRG